MVDCIISALTFISLRLGGDILASSTLMGPGGILLIHCIKNKMIFFSLIPRNIISVLVVLRVQAQILSMTLHLPSAPFKFNYMIFNNMVAKLAPQNITCNAVLSSDSLFRAQYRHYHLIVYRIKEI